MMYNDIHQLREDYQMINTILLAIATATPILYIVTLPVAA